MHFKKGINLNFLVLRERLSRFTLVAVNPSKSSEITANQIIKLLGKLPSKALSSITYDNGSEFSAHKRVNEVLGTKSYFCDPYKSYQKGAVEQVNLWLRERFPRQIALEEITPENINAWVKRINQRPLKCLGYRSPVECFKEHVLAL